MFIYALHDPDTLEVRYVGKTANKLSRRLSDHLRTARNNGKTHRDCWIRSLEHKPIITTLEEVLPEEWQEKERYWITQFPNLTNHTSGGEGLDSATASRINKGRPVTRATRKKMSESVKRSYAENGLPWDIGNYPRSEWHIQRIRETTGKLTEEKVERIREAYQNGAKQKDLASEYGVTQTCISKIVTNQMWKRKLKGENNGCLVT